MEWVIVAAIGAVIGTVVGFFSTAVRMPQSVCILLGALGGILGGSLFYLARVELFGGASFYVYGVLLSIGLLAGGLLAYSLTSSERRV